MIRGTRYVALTAAFALLTACGDREAQPTVGPVDVTSIRDHVVYIDHGRNAALLLDVSRKASNARPSVVPLTPNPTHFEARKGHDDQLLVLSAGQPDDGEHAFSPPRLNVVAAKKDAVVTYDYDSAFDRVSQSDDGRFAILSYSPSAATTGSSLLFNPNEIAIVDLENQEGPFVRTLQSVGGSLRNVAFSPPMTVGDSAPRTFAVVLFESELSILDLWHPERPEFTVELSRRGTTHLTLSQVLFSEKEPKVYLRAEGSNDVYVISLSQAEPGETRANDYVPVLNQLGAGVGPSDLALFDEGGETRLLVTSPGSKEAIVIEPNGSNVTSVPLPRAATHILRYEGLSPFDDRMASRALLYGGDGTSVTFLDLEDIEERASRNVDLLTVAKPFSSAIAIDERTVMLVHESTGLSLLDLDGRTVAEISGPNLEGAVSDPNVNKLWLPPKGQSRLGFLDLDQGFHPSEVRVDAPIESLITVPSSDTPRVVVTHPSSIGWITVLDANDPTNAASAFSLRGFLLTGAP